jgi:hypothetical protein
MGTKATKYNGYDECTMNLILKSQPDDIFGKKNTKTETISGGEGANQMVQKKVIITSSFIIA